MGTLIVGIIVVTIVAFIIRGMLRDKKNGNSPIGCGGDCGHCSGHCH